MHFKSAVILFALYFVTAAQSVALNEIQLDEIRLLFRTYENGIYNISKDDIVSMGESIGMNNISDFVYKQGVANAIQLLDLLVFLANNDKKTDDIKKSSLLPYEVKFYVDLFSKKDREGNKDGLLGYDEVMEVIDALDLENWTSFDYSKSALQCLKNGFEINKKINASDFLHRIWEVKPEGTGLDRKQVEDLMTLHNDNKIDGHINPVGIMKFLKKLSIFKKDYEGQLAFDPKRKAALELQDLLMLSAEYSNEEKVGTVYTTPSVRQGLSDFSIQDVNKDGLLDNDEVMEIANHYVSTSITKENIVSFMIKHDANKDQRLDLAEFFMALFKEGVNLSSYDANDEKSVHLYKPYKFSLI
ncbi:uncharacterized protein LOC126842527 [Adelges cooleyi]|uniref:uncharacterized protein LOC126842527 n=1 Tax=Adelges cooleyi TaxID=133065 RepID=UPI00217FE103|nr:uncharacterized protein LOC126842527 [Adelges cooleyi]